MIMIMMIINNKSDNEIKVITIILASSILMSGSNIAVMIEITNKYDNANCNNHGSYNDKK